jgi:hypothetical protein
MAVSPIIRIEHLLQAVGAHRAVDRDPAALLRRLVGVDDAKAGRIIRRFGFMFDGDRLHIGQRRRLVTDAAHEGVTRSAVAPRIDDHALRIVAHRAVQIEFMGQSVDEGPKSHALYLAGDPPCAADACLGIVRGWIGHRGTGWQGDRRVTDRLSRTSVRVQTLASHWFMNCSPHSS